MDLYIMIYPVIIWDGCRKVLNYSLVKDLHT